MNYPGPQVAGEESVPAGTAGPTIVNGHAPTASRLDEFHQRPHGVPDAPAVAPPPPTVTLTEHDVRNLGDVRNLCRGLMASCTAMVQGRDAVIEMILTSLFADGHILLEDHPGSGKTTLAKALGNSIVRGTVHEHIASFRRIQFTPDLLPSDVTGTTVFDPQHGTFAFRAGPIFANVVLADEINRTSPKVQAALLEAMAEKQVTIDNQTHPLEDLFFVIATQNPFDLVGTYPLPKAQLDRFLFKVRMTYLERESELEVLARWNAARKAPTPCHVSPEAIVKARGIIQESVRVAPIIHEGLVDIAHALRKDRRVAQGASTRSLVLAIPALQARAAMQDRDYVSHRDLKALVIPLFSHRLDLMPGVKDADLVVTQCAEPVLEVMARRTLK